MIDIKKKTQILKWIAILCGCLWATPFMAHYIKLLWKGPVDDYLIFFGILGLLYWLSIGIVPILIIYFIVKWFLKRKKIK